MLSCFCELCSFFSREPGFPLTGIFAPWYNKTGLSRRFFAEESRSFARKGGASNDRETEYRDHSRHTCAGGGAAGGGRADAQSQSSTGESEILITVDGREWGRYPLSQPQTVVVEQADGSRNEIVITGEGAYMHASSLR